MSETARPRRSLLFVPAGNARALEKSDGLAADGLIYDLEDSAAPGEELRWRASGCASILRPLAWRPLAFPVSGSCGSTASTRPGAPRTF